MSSTSRRSFFATAGAGLVTAAGLLALNQPWAQPRILGLGRSTYVPLVGSEFSVSAAGVHSTVVLSAVSNLIGAPAGSERGFSLLFAPVTGSALTPQIYTVAHRDVGTAELYLSPVDRGASLQYQVIINQHTAEELR